ncbi:alpha/beta hydrolase [Nocardioides daejeonensis]|uniref:alpha/beta hydrolase n=1 Tax=Nocardioides daejeonensis TaxID=1046556 RepID=UPI000D74410D|nr:alpha/beta hydrolase [Nocardioides daejeonensis]
MATVSQVLAWRPALLDELACVTLRHRRSLADLADELVAARPPASWWGDDATAAVGAHTLLRDRLNDLAAELAALTRGLVQAEAGSRAARRVVTEATVAAGGHGMVVDDVTGEVRDPAPVPADPILAADRARLRLELTDRLAQGLRAAEHTDAALAAVLDAVVSGVLDGGTAGPVEAIAAGRQAAERPLLPLPVDARVAEAFGWWRSLSPGERIRLVGERSELVGNTEGIPPAPRDRANRLLLTEARRELTTRLRELEGASWLDRLLSGSSESPAVLHAKLEDLSAISALLTARPGARLLSLGLDGRERVTTDVGLGRVRTAENVVVTRYGVGTTPASDLARKTAEVEALLARMSRLSDEAGDDARHAAIVSLGYEAPPLAIRDLLDPGSAGERARGLLHDDIARDAAPRFADQLNAVDVVRRDDPHLTVAAHSYAGVVTGHALQQGTGVDDVVALGVPGLATDRLADLHLAPGHLHNLEAKHDLVADAGRFGRDLTYLDGVRELDTAAHADRGLAEVVGHTSYYTDGSTSQHNLAAVASGHAELAIDDTRGPDLTDELREAGHDGRELFDRGVRATKGFLVDRGQELDRLLRRLG